MSQELDSISNKCLFTLKKAASDDSDRYYIGSSAAAHAGVIRELRVADQEAFTGHGLCRRQRKKLK